MSTELSIRPSYLTGAPPTNAFSDSIGFANPARISMRDDRFNVIDENGAAALPAALNIDVIMLWENDARIYFPLTADGKSTYEQDSTIPPTCFSDDRVAPSANAMQPQSELCANCPRAVRDLPSYSGTNLVSACKDQYKVAVLVAGAGGSVFLLGVKPASRKAYANYRRHLRANHANPNEVITRLGYKDKALTFEFSGWINEKTVNVVAKIMDTDEPKMIVGAFVQEQRPALPPRAAPVQIAAPLTVKGGDQFAMEAPITTRPVTETFVPPGPIAPETFAPTEAPRGRGRPRKDAAAPSPVASAATFTPPTSSPAPRADFGLQVAETPPNDIQLALDRAFGA